VQLRKALAELNDRRVIDSRNSFMLAWIERFHIKNDEIDVRQLIVG